MPNLAARYGASATTCYGERTPIIETLINALGTAYWLDDEQKLDELTVLNGSGPALFYGLCVVMAKHFQVEEQLVKDTLLSTSELVKHQPQKSFEQLISEIATKGGVTEAALKVLMPLFEKGFN